MIIMDNLLSQKEVDKIHDILCGHDFPWYYNPNTINKDLESSFFKDNNTMNTGQFTHSFFVDGSIKSNYFRLVYPFLFLLEKKFNKDFMPKLSRIKANLLVKNNLFSGEQYNYPHVDSNFFPGESLLYYVNDSDGDTFIFKEKKDDKFENVTLDRRITPQKGKSIFFDSDYYHASSCPIKSDKRIVINFLFHK